MINTVQIPEFLAAEIERQDKEKQSTSFDAVDTSLKNSRKGKNQKEKFKMFLHGLARSLRYYRNNQDEIIKEELMNKCKKCETVLDENYARCQNCGEPWRQLDAWETELLEVAMDREIKLQTENTAMRLMLRGLVKCGAVTGGGKAIDEDEVNEYLEKLVDTITKARELIEGKTVQCKDCKRKDKVILLLVAKLYCTLASTCIQCPVNDNDADCSLSKDYKRHDALAEIGRRSK